MQSCLCTLFALLFDRNLNSSFLSSSDHFYHWHISPLFWQILLWNVSEQTDSPIESLQHQTNETNQGLNIQAPVFEPTDPKLSSVPSVHSARRRLWDDVPEDDNDFEEERIEIAKQPRRSISDSELRSLNRYCSSWGGNNFWGALKICSFLI